ncbi:MAG: class I SAM-dependent methyltransferase [Thermotogota bacterium]
MKEVEQYYDLNPLEEWNRLNRHKLEFDMMKNYFKKYLTPHSTILDAGGGPGRIAIHLSQLGHRVTLLDLSSENLRFAKEKANENQVHLKGYIHSNILELDKHVTDIYDNVLCLGPLYHLIHERDRRKAISNCLNVLKPGGLLFAAFISSYAPIQDFIVNYPEKIVGFKEKLLRYLDDGVNIVSKENKGFTTAFFMNPLDIEPFMASFPLEQLSITALEGLFSQSEEIINKLPQSIYLDWLDICHKTSTNPITWGGSQHLLYVGRKKEIEKS